MKGTFRKEDIPTDILSPKQHALLLAILERYEEIHYTSDNDQYWFFCDKFSIEVLFPTIELKSDIRLDGTVKINTSEKALEFFLDDILSKERRTHAIYFQEEGIRNTPVTLSEIKNLMVLSTESHQFKKIVTEDAEAIYKYMEEKKPKLIQEILERNLAKNSSQA